MDRLPYATEPHSPGSEGLRKSTHDRFVAALVRIGWIVVIGAAVASLRSAALAARPPKPPPGRTPSLVGEWHSVINARDKLVFGEDGEFHERSCRGRFHVEGNNVRVVDVRYGDGKREMRHLGEWMKLAEIRFKVALIDDTLTITGRENEWHYAYGDPFDVYGKPYLEEVSNRKTYKRHAADVP
jgi:hypothetical protein